MLQYKKSSKLALPLSTFALFIDDKMRFGINQKRKLRFLFVSALTFHYLCKTPPGPVAEGKTCTT